jgi:hypothetical protein
MKTILLLALLLGCAPCLAFASDSAEPPAPSATKPWFRNAGEYIANRSLRIGIPTSPSSKILTDGKRFDVTLGKRIPLYTWEEDGPGEAWTFGIDGGMLASLVRYSNNGRLTFATDTFDGFFGAYLAKAWDGWLAMARYAHLSAHLVDNSPQILNPVGYSQFWEELTLGKSFPAPSEPSDWDLQLQGSIGLNHTSMPAQANPRLAFGASFGHALWGPDSLAVLTSADLLKAGVAEQKATYSFFLGVGTLNRPETTHRPFRAGITHFSGADYRNQFYFRKHTWTTFEVALEF